MMRVMTRLGMGLLAACLLSAPAAASAQEADRPARAVLERAAAAMGGLERLQGLDNVVLTGFGQRVYQQGGGFLTGMILGNLMNRRGGSGGGWGGGGFGGGDSGGGWGGFGGGDSGGGGASSNW